MEENGLWGTQEIAEYLEVAPKTVRRYIHERGLPATLIGGTYYTTADLVDSWVEEQAKEDTRKRMEERNSAHCGGQKAVSKEAEEGTA